jgi:hypothetical protein
MTQQICSKYLGTNSFWHEKSVYGECERHKSVFDSAHFVMFRAWNTRKSQFEEQISIKFGICLGMMFPQTYNMIREV